MLSSLPQELFEKIGLLLDTRSYLKLSCCNQELYRKANSSDFVWKIKAKQEYSKILDSDYKAKYIKFYKTLCIVCYRKTASKHPFYNTKICKKCSKLDAEYCKKCSDDSYNLFSDLRNTISDSLKSGIFIEGSFSGSQASDEPIVNNLSWISLMIVLL